MRVVFASAVSGLVHVLALGGLAVWMLDFGTLEYRVAAGHVVTVRFSPAADQPHDAPVEQPITLQQAADSPPPSRETPTPPQPSARLEVERQVAVVEIAAELAPVEAPPSDQPSDQPSEHPTLSSASKTEVAQLPLAPDQRPRRARPTAAPPQLAVAAIPLDFAAAAIAGASTPDELPRKLPLNPAPPYPLEALLAGIEGRVVLRVRISGSGDVESLSVATSSGSTLLDDAASTAVRVWRFEPARKRGIPILFEALVPVTFRIRRS